jgi:hypothetical protein
MAFLGLAYGRWRQRLARLFLPAGQRIAAAKIWRMAAVVDTSQTYLSFLMLHACFTPFASCFVYTSWRFYAISGTNLLTRCHSVSFLFSAVFVF